MKATRNNFAPNSKKDVSTTLEHREDGLNPNTSVPVKLTFWLSGGAALFVLLATLYYYGVFS